MAGNELTAQQRRVLRFVEAFSAEHGFSPSLREIGQGVGLANVNAVRGHVQALERKGRIRRDADKARSIRLAGPPSLSLSSRLKRSLHKVLRTDDGVSHQVVYGLAWATWQRRAIFVGELADRLGEALQREAAEHGWTLLGKTIRPDHVIVTVRTWPNHSPEQTVRRLQSAGRALKRRRPGDFPGRRLWEKGYLATTDTESLAEMAGDFLAGSAEAEA